MSESLDWAAALDAPGVRELTPELMRSTVGFVLKNNEDIDLLDEIMAQPETCSCGGDGEACEHHHAHQQRHG